jgi:YgiT-type zinc finger domain-containing protein
MTTVNNEELCPRCLIGRLRDGVATFSVLYQGELLVVPQVKAFTCDICDYREYDDALITWVSELTGFVPPQENNNPSLPSFPQNPSQRG